MGRKQEVNVVSIRWCLSDFRWPVGGAMDMTQVRCIGIFRATPSTLLRNLVWMGNCVLKELMVNSKWENGFHRHAHQVWQSQKLSTTFDLQSMSECEDCGVKSLGEDNFWTRHYTDFLCPVGGAMDMTQFWSTYVFRATPSTFLRNLAEIGNCMLKLEGLYALWRWI